MTNTYTDLAIDAFRKQESARRRLAKAEAAAAKALRLVPAEDVSVYVAETEQIRRENDAKDHPGEYTSIPYLVQGGITAIDEAG